MTAPPAFANRVIFALSLAGFVLFWSALSWLKGDPHILPGPAEVLRVAGKELASGRLAHHMAATLMRVGVAFSLAMVLGSLLGYALGRAPRLNRWADPWVTIFLNLPALVVIVLCYLWIGLNEVAAITAVTLNKTALVLVTLREGSRTLRPDLADMARVFRLPALQRFRHILLPQLAPFLLASARTGLAIIWKIVLVVEFLGRSSGVGFQIHMKFQLFDIPGLLAYALSFIAVMLMVEYLLIQPLDRRATAWRNPAP